MIKVIAKNNLMQTVTRFLKFSTDTDVHSGKHENIHVDAHNHTCTHTHTHTHSHTYTHTHTQHTFRYT